MKVYAIYSQSEYLMAIVSRLHLTVQYIDICNTPKYF